MILGHLCEYCKAIHDSVTVCKISTIAGVHLKTEQLCDDCIPKETIKIGKAGYEMKITDEVKMIELHEKSKSRLGA